MPHSRNRKLRTIVYGLAVVALLSFYTFINDTTRLGGDAMTGRVENGHYYVGNPRGFTEVTLAEYRTNKILAVTLLVIWPVTIIALLYIEWDRTKAFGKRLKMWEGNLWQGKASQQKISKKKHRQRN